MVRIKETAFSQYDIAIMSEIDTFPCGVFVNREPFDREKRASMIFGTRGGIACDLFQEREGDNPAIMRCDKSGKRRPRSSKKRGEKETRERKKERKEEGKRETSDKARRSNRPTSRTYCLAYERPLGGLGERIVK